MIQCFSCVYFAQQTTLKLSGLKTNHFICSQSYNQSQIQLSGCFAAQLASLLDKCIQVIGWRETEHSLDPRTAGLLYHSLCDYGLLLFMWTLCEIAPCSLPRRTAGLLVDQGSQAWKIENNHDFIKPRPETSNQSNVSSTTLC